MVLFKDLQQMLIKIHEIKKLIQFWVFIVRLSWFIKGNSSWSFRFDQIKQKTFKNTVVRD